MANTTTERGICPFCETDITDGVVLIQYEIDDERRAFIECPACEQPVTPE